MKKFETKEEAKKFYNEVVKPIAESLHIPPHYFVRVKGVEISPNPTFDKFRISDYEMSTEVKAGQVIFPIEEAPMPEWLHRRHINASVTEMDPWKGTIFEATLTGRIASSKGTPRSPNDKIAAFDTLDHCIRNGRRMGLSSVLKENLALVGKLEKLTKENSANKEQLNIVRQVIEDMTASGGNLSDVVHLTRQLGIFDKGQEATPQEKKPVRKLVVAEINEGRGSGLAAELNLAEQGKYVILSTEAARRMHKRAVYNDDVRILADAIEASTRHA